MSLALVIVVWLAAALVIGASGALARSPVPPPAIALILTVVLLVGLRASSVARGAVHRLGLGPLVAVHLVRVVAGAYFLVLYRRGELPGAFALAAGWGDIAVGLGAAVVLMTCIPVRTARQRTALRLWNAAGLLDILGVLTNGARLFLQNPAIALPFTTLPVALLPLFVVPIVIVTHVLVFAWSGKRRSPGAHI
jgi:hypothetical protein